MKHEQLLGDLLHRIGETRDQIGTAWPYHADPDTGIWQTVEDGDWCGGHWVECLRIKGVLEGRPELEKGNQFRGHRFYYSAARMYAQTGNPALRALALAAAYSMRVMAIPHNGAMPIGLEMQVKSTTLAARNTFGYWQDKCGDQAPAWDFDDPGGPVDTSASTIVIEQLARMAVEDNDAAAQEFTRHLAPMIDGLMPHMRGRGRLVGGCFNQPREFANKNELIWGTAYLLMALSYLNEGRIIC